MPHTPTNPRFSCPGFLERFRCPLETCQRLFKSSRGWTRHICSVHPDFDISYAICQKATVKIPISNIAQFLPLEKDRILYSSPPTSSIQCFESFDEIPNVPQVDKVPFLPCLPLSVQSSPLPSDNEASYSRSEHSTEYHHFINGISSLSNI